MTRGNDDGTSPIDALIDRLVDGELEDSARVALLTRLEASPEGWRRCALAFLEAQAWREAFAPPKVKLGSVEPRADGATHGVSEGMNAAGSRPRRPRPTFKTARIAAAVLAAFGTGWLAREWSRPTFVPVARSPVPGPSARDEPRLVEHPVVRENDERTAFSGLQPVPAGEATASDSVQLLEDDGPLPASFVRQLQRRGYQVEQRDATLSMDFRDGRRLNVPVGELKVQYVGDRTY